MKLSQNTLKRIQKRHISPIIQECITEQQKHSTYHTDDVILLVETLNDFQFTDVKTKEQLIQSGKKHYSQMLSKEAPPTETQLAIYEDALDRYKEKIAKGVKALAIEIEENQIMAGNKEIVLISLIRAGLPLGVLIQREMRRKGVKSIHYGLSIIRDKGLDPIAMKAIQRQHPNAYFAFVDGWVGKGAITRQLRASCEKHCIPFSLYALSDPTEDLSTFAPYATDWLIPFGILGSVISGLLSRTIYQGRKLHGAIYYETLKRDDVTDRFLNTVTPLLETVTPAECDRPDNTEASILNLCEKVMADFGVEKLNNIKPSIAEATRAVLRRVPEKVLVSSKQDPDLALLLELCEKQGVEVLEYPTAPYRAITIIKKS